MYTIYTRYTESVAMKTRLNQYNFNKIIKGIIENHIEFQAPKIPEHSSVFLAQHTTMLCIRSLGIDCVCNM